MLAQLDTRVMSSFLLYLDHEIQSKGSGFKNQVVSFYPEASPINGMYVFTSPVKPLCNDTSIAGANIMSGVYIGNSYISVGQSGLKYINHYKGALYFTGINPETFGQPISGNAAIKEFSVKITDKTDWKLMFETKYVNNGSMIAPTTGLDLDTELAPIVFIRYRGQENKPFGFSRLDNQTNYFRTIIIADNEFQKIAVSSILKNLNYRTIPLSARTTFDALGNMTGTNYNFTGMEIDTSLTPMVLSVKAIDVPQEGNYKDVRRSMSIVDFEVSTIGRSP
jgi:hypothetical protein